MQELGLSEVSPLITHLSYPGPYSVFLHPESPQGYTIEAAAVADGLMATTSSAY